MPLSVVSSPHLRAVFVSLALLPATINVAVACIQGHRFDPPKPAKLQPPPLAPVKVDDLFSARPLELPKLPLIRPEIAPPVSDAPAAPPLPLAAAAPSQQQAFVAYVREFEARRVKDAGVPDTIDYAVALIHLGRYATAIQTLVALEAAQPGVYETAANLGTAYELAGNLEEAAVWIARGLERNADSHAGTEWLHAAILHAKLMLRDDPAWLKTHSVLDLAGDRTAEEIVHAIDYQLAERLHFVAAPDAIVCELFYQAALRVGGKNAEARRAHYLRESLRFGDGRKAEIAARAKT